MDDPVRETLRRARVIAGALVVGVIVLVAVAASVVLPVTGALDRIVGPVAVIGLVSPVVGYRLYLFLRERATASADARTRCNAFLQATVVALAVTEGVAFLGTIVYLLTRALPALSGVATHVLLAGAVWPSAERLEGFLEGAARDPARR